MVFRKFVFLALLGLLGAVLAWMIFISREQGRSQVDGPVEASRTLSSTPTRVLDPQDLLIVESAVRFVPGDAASGNPGGAAGHTVVILNRGSVTYRNLLLSFAFQGTGGEDVDRKILPVEDRELPPGETITLDLKTTEISPGASRCQVRILYAEIGTAAPAPPKG